MLILIPSIIISVFLSITSDAQAVSISRDCDMFGFRKKNVFFSSCLSLILIPFIIISVVCFNTIDSEVFRQKGKAELHPRLFVLGLTFQSTGVFLSSIGCVWVQGKDSWAIGAVVVGLMAVCPFACYIV